VYLAALAAALAFSTLSPALIVAVMLAGWALVAMLEWAAAAERPHYAAGMPPRWRSPRFTLPPAQPLEQVSAGYPEPGLDEAATWIASAADREELLGAWPILLEPEDTQEAPPEDWVVVELPPPLPAEPEPVADLTPLPEPIPEPVADAQPEPAPVAVATVQAVEARLARYHFDPFAEPERRRFRRRQELDAVLVPAKPANPPLPRTYREDDA
jgi:hypothetical protein